MSIVINVGVDEIYDELSSYDKEELIELLYEDGSLDYHPHFEMIRTHDMSASFDQEQFNKSLSIIGRSYYRLSNGQIEYINNLAKRL